MLPYGYVVSRSFDDGGGWYTRVRTTPGGATKPGACSGNAMVNTRVCAGRRPRLTLHGSVHKNIANISYSGLVDRMFTEAEGKSPGWFRRSSECWSSSEGSFDGMIVERMVRKHQGNPLCRWWLYVGVLDGITPIDTWRLLQFVFKRCARVSALLKERTHFMCLLLEIALHAAQADPKMLTV